MAKFYEVRSEVERQKIIRLMEDYFNFELQFYDLQNLNLLGIHFHAVPMWPHNPSELLLTLKQFEGLQLLEGITLQVQTAKGLKMEREIRNLKPLYQNLADKLGLNDHVDSLLYYPGRLSDDEEEAVLGDHLRRVKHLVFVCY